MFVTRPFFSTAPGCTIDSVCDLEREAVGKFEMHIPSGVFSSASLPKQRWVWIKFTPPSDTNVFCITGTQNMRNKVLMLRYVPLDIANEGRLQHYVRVAPRVSPFSLVAKDTREGEDGDGEPFVFIVRSGKVLKEPEPVFMKLGLVVDNPELEDACSEHVVLTCYALPGACVESYAEKLVRVQAEHTARLVAFAKTYAVDEMRKRKLDEDEEERERERKAKRVNILDGNGGSNNAGFNLSGVLGPHLKLILKLPSPRPSSPSPSPFPSPHPVISVSRASLRSSTRKL